MTEKQKTRQFIPLLSSEAGSCLTMDNWEAVGVTRVSYRLDDLLMKPGLAVLQSMGDIHYYLAWTNEIVINASFLSMTSTGDYIIRSHYDGSLTRLSLEELVALIGTLNADVVLLPPGSANVYQQYWQGLSSTSQLYFYERIAGHPYQYVNIEPHATFPLSADVSDGREIYLQGDVTVSQLAQLSHQKKYWLESNKPANDAIEGILYSEGCSFQLLDDRYHNDHKVIDKHCSCPTCSQQLTRAYLHHLLQQTPLLAQRYLIQHNVDYFQHASFTAE